MYDDIVDLSGGLFDFDGGPQMSQHPESMYIDDDLYDSYSAEAQGDLAAAVSKMANGKGGENVIGYYERISLSDLFDQCVLPTLSQAFFSISTIVGLCIVCRSTCLFCHTGQSYLYFCTYLPIVVNFRTYTVALLLCLFICG